MIWVYIIIALVVLIALIYWLKSRKKGEAPAVTPEAPSTDEPPEGEEKGQM